MKLLKYFLLSFLVLSVSCKNECENVQQEAKKMMKNWYKKKIVFPSDMEKLTNSTDNYETGDLSALKRYTIVHFFTADCDKCINELNEIKKSLQNIPENENISHVFIASAPTKIYVSDAIKKTNFPYPIYYESEYYSFKMMNMLPVSDDLYNTMLLNAKHEVLLFGAFYNNKKAETLYSKIIECNL